MTTTSPQPLRRPSALTERAPRLVKMRRFGVREGSTLPISLASGAVILAAWWIVAELRLVPHLFLPTPAEVVNAAVSIFQDGYANATLFEHVGASLLRIFAAAAIAIALGIPIGLLMGLNKWAKGVFDTPIEFYWPLPPLAYLPLMIIWLGIGETSKIVLLALAMFAPIVLSAQAGVRSVSQERVNAALSLRDPLSAVARDRAPLRAAGNPHRHPHLAWRRLGNARRRGADRGDARHRLSHHVGVAFPGDGRRLRRHRNHRGLRFRLLLRHAPPGGMARALEGTELRDRRDPWTDTLG